MAALAGKLAVPPGQAAQAVLAVAGPVQGGRVCQPPNIAYPINVDDLPAGLIPGDALLINDFEAQARGCRQFGQAGSQRMVAGTMDQGLIQAVVGAGTGLGKAALLPDGRGGYSVLSSEGGHAAFPFAGPEEFAFQEFVLKTTGEPYARWETVVSGAGLALVYAFCTGERLSPPQVAARLDADSPATALFARFFGRACRDWTLEVVAQGGLYVSGGVAAKNRFLVSHPAFAQEFRRSVSHAGLLAGVGVALVPDESVGLWGAAALAASRLG